MIIRLQFNKSFVLKEIKKPQEFIGIVDGRRIPGSIFFHQRHVIVASREPWRGFLKFEHHRDNNTRFLFLFLCPFVPSFAL